MKCNFGRILNTGKFLFFLITFLTCLSSFNSEFLAANKAKLAASTKTKDTLPKSDDVISDKEIQDLLKDPKYADIASNPELVKSLTASLKEDSLKSSSTPAPHPKHAAASPHPHYMSASYKAHLARVKHTSPSAKKSALSDGAEDESMKVSKNDLMKDLSLDNLPLDSSVSPLNARHRAHGHTTSDKADDKVEKEKPVIQDKFKDFDFISKQQARYLIEILKQPVFMNMLPPEAQSIIKTVRDNFQFKAVENGKINDFIETSLLNSPTSQTFIDPDGKIGRKGTLTLIDPENGTTKYAWAVSNAKVLCFFQSQSFLTIVKLYRNSSLKIKDIIATPCFLIHSPKDPKDGSLLACSSSTQEKEVWIQTIKSNITNN